jgi:hypothetical protein
MNLASWLRSIAGPKKQKVSARWLQPNENIWRLPILDCTQYADGMTSFTESPQVAQKYSELRKASGQELPGVEFKPIQSVPCNLAYEINKRPADGPVFKSRIMEEKWDIYSYDERLFFCRSWSGELIYRAAVKCELPTFEVLMVESSEKLPEKLAVQQVDFLVKSHLLLAMALHPLLAELGHDAEKQAMHSFGRYGNKGRYGTLEETIGTAYYWNQSPLKAR